MKKSYTLKEASGFLVSCFLIGIVIGCYDNSFISAPIVNSETINLGSVSTMMNVINTTPIVNNNFTITMNLTPGAMYSLQLTHINGTVLHNHGFTSNSTTVTKVLDYTAIPNGSYDLNLMDTSGRVLRVPVIIQH